MADGKLRLTYDQERHIEAYARALDHIMVALIGDEPSTKRYDPMTVEGGVMHSYAFNMKDGGRHHPVRDYQSVEEIEQVLLREAVDWVRNG